MLARLIGKLSCSLVLLCALTAYAADGNQEVFSPWTIAPACATGKVCVYLLASDNQLYVADSTGSRIKMQAAKSFRTSANCAALASPANGDVCYDSGTGAFMFYAGGWKSLYLASGGTPFSSVTGADKGVLGAATTHYLVAPGQAATGTVEAVLSVAPRAGYGRNLRCFLGVAPGGADTVVVTVRKNSADSALTCTISAAATTCSDTTNTFAVSAGNRLSISSVSSAGTASDLTCSFEVTN